MQNEIDALAHLLKGKPVPRAALLLLERATEAQPEQLDLDAMTSHTFAPGVYARTIEIPEDCFVIGKIHKHAHLNFLQSGVVTVASEFHTETFSAPRMWVSEPGIKRAVLALEDTVWVTIHPNPDNTTDLKVMEGEVIAPSYAALDAFLLGVDV
jgi:hypothetical protein